MNRIISLSVPILVFVIISFSQEKKNRFFSEEEIILNTSNGDIYGSLIVPKRIKTKIPVVLIIAGSGPTDRNGNNGLMKNNSLKMLAVGLGENKIASLRYDKRCIGESKNACIPEKDLRFENYINDAAEWIEKLKTDERFSYVAVMGHSEGSLIGIIASEKSKADKFISLAGVGNRINIVIKEQLKDQPVKIKEEFYAILDSLTQGDTVVNINSSTNSLFRKSIQPYLISWIKYDPQIEIKKLKIPVLLIQGTTDIQVSVNEVNLLKNSSSDAELKIFENMNHVLKDSSDDYAENIKTYYNPDLSLKKGLIEVISEFIIIRQ
ncbi:MAG: alpha/beta hydrolase [Bacteroidota bacterium]